MILFFGSGGNKLVFYKSLSEMIFLQKTSLTYFFTDY